MKSRLLISFVAATLFASVLPIFAADTKTLVKCTDVIAKLESNLSRDPARVLLVIEDALTTNDACSCEIIKAAITVSKADDKLVGEIVSTAINAAPTAASTIGECALTAAPTAAKETKAAMKAALVQGDGAGEEPLSAGKEPIVGKDIVTAPRATAESDYNVSPVDVTGIYLSVPSGRGTPETIVKIIRSCDCHEKKNPGSGSAPATKT